MSKQPNQLYEFGEFKLDAAERVLQRGNEPVPLTPKAFETLLVLVQRSGHVVEKDELMKQVWADAFVEEANLARNVWTLRKALGDDEREHHYIETVPKLGYRFVAPVRELTNEAVSVLVRRHVKARIVTEEDSSDNSRFQIPAERSAHSDSGVLVPDANAKMFLPPSAKASWWSKRNTASLVLAIAVLAAIVFLAAMMISRNSLSRMPEAIDSIAVLPFVNSSSDPEVDYLSDGLTETTINSLSQIPGLRVVSRTTMFRYKGRQGDPERIGKELGVRSVLLGRISKRGDALSVQTELIDVVRDAQLWGQQYDRKMSDLPNLQQQISQQLATSLRVKLTGEERTRLAKPSTEKPEAYHAYLKGRYFWNQRNENGLKKAVAYFEEAVKIDPDYALAHSGLADSYTTLGYFSYLAPVEAFPKAKAAAIKAVELDPMLAEPHTSLAYARLYYDWDWPGAEKEFGEAISLNPNYATAHHWYSVYLTAMERPDQAAAEIKRAHELDPLSLIINTDIGFELYYTRHYDQAISQLKTTLEMKPDFPLAHLWLGRAYQEKAMYEEALAEFKTVEASFRGWPVAIAGIGYVDGISGKRIDASKVLRDLSDLSRERYVTSYGVALVYAGLGDRDKAIAWLNKAYEERSHWLVWLKLDPRWDTLRADPRFVDLVRRVGLNR